MKNYCPGLLCIGCVPFDARNALGLISSLFIKC